MIISIIPDPNVGREVRLWNEKVGHTPITATFLTVDILLVVLRYAYSSRLMARTMIADRGLYRKANMLMPSRIAMANYISQLLAVKLAAKL